jgi:hypothetical protein
MWKLGMMDQVDRFSRVDRDNHELLVTSKFKLIFQQDSDV